MSELLSNPKECRLGCLTVLLTYVVIFVLIGVLSKSCKGQSICPEIQVHSQGIQQYGISVTELYKCFGVYENIIVLEDANSDSRLHRGISEIRGKMFGVNYSKPWACFSTSSVGVGKIYVDKYNTHHITTVSRIIGEFKTTIPITYWMEIIIGVTSYPSVISGVKFKLILNH